MQLPVLVTATFISESWGRGVTSDGVAIARYLDGDISGAVVAFVNVPRGPVFNGLSGEGSYF